MTATPDRPDPAHARSGLYVAPNIEVLDALTELVDPRAAMVTVHRSGTIHISALGETFEQMSAHSHSVEQAVIAAGYPVVRFSATLLYLTRAQCDAPRAPSTARLRPGTLVYDTEGDPEDPADTGTIIAVRPGGYTVLWTGHLTPIFAAEGEVTILDTREH